jgi:NADPH:quinone reductase-like Zn-dependent oxidoreductase
MKAVVRNRYGSPEVLRIEELDIPTPKHHEILIHVHATTVNRTDTGILTGTPFVIRFFTGLRKPTYRTPGTDFAGVVESVGEHVTRFQVGDRVWGFHDEGLGSQAEYMTIRDDQPIAPIPEEISFEQAAASIEGAHYAINFIKRVDIRPEHQVLINGASGAIGSAMLQLVKRTGATITAVANTKNIELMKSLGATQVIDYEQEDFTETNQTYDLILDAVGKSSFGACKPLLKDDGIYISSELGPRIENTYLPLITKLRGGKRVLFPFPSDIPRSLEMMSEYLKEGSFRPVIDRTYEVEEIRKAYTYALSGQKTGNLVVRFSKT